jgi:hypothetical protein
MASPDQYKRPDPYQVQLETQKNAALEKARKEKEAAANAKKKKELEFLKTDEQRNKALKLDAEKRYAVADQTYRTAKAAALLPGSDGGVTITPAEQVAVNYLGKIAYDNKQEITAYTNAYTNAYNKRTALEQDLKPASVIKNKKVVKKAIVKKTTTKSTSIYSTSGVNTTTLAGIEAASAGTGASEIPSPPSYYYNAPMVKTAYLNSGEGANEPSPQQRTSGVTISDSYNYSQAADAWTSVIGSKGVIQMDSTSAFSLANSSTKNSSSYDGNLYGFKFLYNPKEVTMTWGVAEGQNWEGIAAGLDPGTAPSAALQNSTISFSLLLNRITDISYLDANGLKPGLTNPYSTFAVPNGKSTNQELAEIYQKGTMYDLEYLFRTLGGLNSNFNSGLNGFTADKGWLQGFAVELHLGNKMRYLVRVSNVEVNHVIFDERMVPTLSYVNITCARFPYIKQA